MRSDTQSVMALRICFEVNKMFRHWGLLPAVLASLVILSGCGTVTNQKLAQDKLSPNELQNYAQNVLSPEELKLFKVPYKIDKDLENMARLVETFGRTKYHQAKQLAVMLLSGSDLGITYSRTSNYTATEAVLHKKANCISYTNLFIGMARALRVDAQYAEVTEVDSFEKVGDTIVYNSHVCAVVYDGPKPYLIDFSLTDYPQYHQWRAISDLEAVASFYNNIASGIFLKREDENYLKEAITYLTMAYKLYPDSPQVYNNLGVVELERGNVEAAEKYFHRSLAIHPGYFAAYNNLASIYLRRGETEEAIKLMREAIASSPGDQFAYNTLARMLMGQEDYAGAEDALKKALRIDKRYSEARHSLGKLYLKLGRGQEALEQFTLALRYQPNDDIARNKMELIKQLAAERN
jgi:tetratricopeptide (TPR) repeat protein